MTQTLIARRDKVVAAWLNQVCPAVDPALAADGAFTFTNAAVAARAATSGRELSASVVSLRQRAPPRARRLASAQTVAAPAGRAPAGLLDSGEYVGVEVTAVHPQHPGWARPAAFFFRRGGLGLDAGRCRARVIGPM